MKKFIYLVVFIAVCGTVWSQGAGTPVKKKSTVAAPVHVVPAVRQSGNFSPLEKKIESLEKIVSRLATENKNFRKELEKRKTATEKIIKSANDAFNEKVYWLIVLFGSITAIIGALGLLLPFVINAFNTHNVRTLKKKTKGLDKRVRKISINLLKLEKLKEEINGAVEQSQKLEDNIKETERKINRSFDFIGCAYITIAPAIANTQRAVLFFTAAAIFVHSKNIDQLNNAIKKILEAVDCYSPDYANDGIIMCKNILSLQTNPKFKKVDFSSVENIKEKLINKLHETQTG